MMAEGFLPALEAAFAAGGIHLVSVAIDYTENMRVLVEELRRCNPGADSG